MYMKQLLFTIPFIVQGFPPPPPNYTQRPIRMAPVANNNSNNPLQSNAAIRLQYQQLHRERLLQQHQQKERLLQQQQKQSMVVPSNATAGADQLCNTLTHITGNRNSFNNVVSNDKASFLGISNYESLLNNVPPNVSLQRSTNVVADSQLSPSYTQSMMQQQLSPSQRGAPFSPQSNTGRLRRRGRKKL